MLRTLFRLCVVPLFAVSLGGTAADDHGPVGVKTSTSNKEYVLGCSLGDGASGQWRY